MNVMLTSETIDSIVRPALAEDTGRGDITSSVLIPPESRGHAVFLAKDDGILAGSQVADRVFALVDASLETSWHKEEGESFRAGDTLGIVAGKLHGILMAERTALNFLQRLCGVATTTKRCADEIKDYPTRILDTRKTTPGLRLLEKYAVAVGGGRNHRLDMAEGILVKDNHLAALRASGLSLEQIVRKARAGAPEGIWVEVEVTSSAEALAARDAGADIILLDNMTPEKMQEAVQLVAGRARTEASGGITLENLSRVAATGVDYISLGALTHSVKSLDISLELATDEIR